MWEMILIVLGLGVAGLIGVAALQRLEFRSVFGRRRKPPRNE